MNDKADELARQLLEKTEKGKLQWHFVAEDAFEGYRTGIEDGFSFWIKRNASGDDKIISFSLTRPEGTVLISALVDNLIGGAMRMSEGQLASKPPSRFPSVDRFRLYSDLFHAARENAVREDRTLEKVQQLLERLG